MNFKNCGGNKIVYLKLTDKCQLKCKHCYHTQSDTTMDNETLNDTIEYIKNLAKENTVLVQFHGGEPLLFDTNKIINIINELRGIVDFGITTNLMFKLNEQHLEIFRNCLKDNAPFIQSSWDYKIRFSNDNAEKLWFDNVRYLKQQGIVVQPTISLTNTLIENVTPKQIFDKFKDFSCLNFERITENGQAQKNKLKPDNALMQKWLLEYFKLSETINQTVPLFVGIKESLKGNLLGCRARQCSKNVITINPNGTVGTCPNIFYRIIGTVDNLYFKDNFEHIRFMESLKYSECLCCPYYQYCNGDCFQLSHDSTGCPGLKMIYEYLLNK